MARHIYHCPLRWSDMDAFGHVNNVVFLRYLEEARVDLMFRPPGAEDGLSFSGGIVVARHEIDYLRPLIHRHEPVTVETWVTEVRGASFTLAYEVKDDENAPGGGSEAGSGGGPGTVYARAGTVLAPYNLTEQRPRRISDEERAFLERFLDDGPAVPGTRAGQGGSGALVA